MTTTTKKPMPPPRRGHVALAAAAAEAEPPRKSASVQREESAYASRFTDTKAMQLATDLAPCFPGVDPTTKRDAATSKDKKQLDINFATPKFGLVLGASLKSVHIREYGGRCMHNVRRDDEELKIKATIFHERQPWAVKVAMLLLPFDARTGAKRGMRRRRPI